MALGYLANLGHFLPELTIIITMMSLLFMEASYHEDELDRPYLLPMVGTGAAVASFFLFKGFYDTPTAIFTGAAVIDPFSSLIKFLMTAGTFAACYLTTQSKDIDKRLKVEFAVLALGVLVGGMLLASANNMLTLYLGIETLSILSYVMASLKRNDELSSEAGLKYALYGGVSGGVMLFGMGHLFGTLGSINFTEMAPKLAGLSTEQLAVVIPSFLLFLSGIGYKIACVPFHMWSPDVYEGSPLPVTAFFSIVPKAAGIAAFVRITQTLFTEASISSDVWAFTLGVIGAATMTIGNISAINQRSVKRMLAYSSISHAGLMLMGVLVNNSIGNNAILLYLTAYLFMTLVAFYITTFVSDEHGNDHFERFNGLIGRYPMMAIAMSVTMFSLAGLPPLSGFIAKFNILSALINKGLYTLAVIAALNSVVALYYYLKIVRNMVFCPAEGEGKIEGLSIRNQIITFGVFLPVVVIGLFWNGLATIASQALLFIPR